MSCRPNKLSFSRELSNYIKQKKCIFSLNVNSSHKELIENNLYALRCLAYHQTQNRKGIERLTLRFYREYIGHRRPTNTKFKGMSLEEIFSISTLIYSISTLIYFKCSRMKYAFTFIGHAECIKIP